jgi:hypothetical protein
VCKMNNGKDEACFVAESRRKLTIGDPTSQITLSKRCDNVAFSLFQRKNFTF